MDEHLGAPAVTALSAATLAEIGTRVPVPEYDRAEVAVGIVHFGVGGFHRAHQAAHVDALLRRGDPDARHWGICGVGVLPTDRRMQQVLGEQDGLYTLVLRDADGSWEPRVVGSIVAHLFAPDDPEAVLERLADPTTRIVSLTITEGGYNFSALTGEFDAREPTVLADLRPGAVPGGVFGLVVEGLRRRRERGVPPFAVMSCDNIQGNGHVARRVFTAFARLRDAELGEWIAQEVRFPNSMVDRITPGTTDDDREQVRERFGIADGWPVVCEPFSQWVLEDDFGPLGRPRLEDVGVQLVADVEPYELMKLRLLNASHQALAYFGHLAGHRLVHEAAQDPVFAEFLLQYMQREARPTLAPVPGVDLDRYCTQLVERFGNAGVRDTIARLCAETSDRIPKWLLPVVREDLAAGRDVSRSAAVVASWARYAEGVDEDGDPIQVVDRLADELGAAARRQREEPLAFLAQRSVFGDLVDDERFTTAYRWALDSLHERGARATLTELVHRDGWDGGA